MEMIQNYQEPIERALTEQVSYWHGMFTAVTKNYTCCLNVNQMSIICTPYDENKCKVFIEIGKEKTYHWKGGIL